MRHRVLAATVSFAEKSAELHRFHLGFRANFPRNLAITGRVCGVSMKSHRKNRMGREHETHRSCNSAPSRRCHRHCSTDRCQRAAISVRHRRQFACELRTEHCYARCNPRGHWCCDRGCRRKDQLGMGRRAPSRHRGNLRIAADCRLDSRIVRRVEQPQ
jgi:hypothetical protein